MPDLDPLDSVSDYFEEHARHDGQYAIAFAVLELARQQRRLVEAVDAIGMNVHKANTASSVPGALEAIVMELKKER